MKILTLLDDNLVINAEILQEAEYVVELEPGEAISDFDRIQNLTNYEILDEMDSDEDSYMQYEDTYADHSYLGQDDLGAIDTEHLIFVRYIDLCENLDEEQLSACAFYSTDPGGYAYEIVQRDLH